MGGDGSHVRGLEPAIFLDLMKGHGFQWWFGAHDYDRLELAVDFSGFAPDEKLADIKFGHVRLPLEIILLIATQSAEEAGSQWSGSMAVVAGRRRSYVIGMTKHLRRFTGRLLSGWLRRCGRGHRLRCGSYGNPLHDL